MHLELINNFRWINILFSRLFPFLRRETVRLVFTADVSIDGDRVNISQTFCLDVIGFFPFDLIASFYGRNRYCELICHRLKAPDKDLRFHLREIKVFIREIHQPSKDANFNSLSRIDFSLNRSLF